LCRFIAINIEFITKYREKFRPKSTVILQFKNKPISLQTNLRDEWPQFFAERNRLFICFDEYQIEKVGRDKLSERRALAHIAARTGGNEVTYDIKTKVERKSFDGTYVRDEVQISGNHIDSWSICTSPVCSVINRHITIK
jgi:hypothetical protein